MSHPAIPKEHCAPGERWEVVERVLASPYFSRSARLRDFLTYICERALTDRTQEISEQQLGAIVFGRGPDFNPAADNIVRVEARNLRQRLEQYFEREGKDEPFVISVPKGGYVPVFEARTAPQPEPLPLPIPEPVLNVPTEPTVAPARKNVVPVAIACALAVLCIALAFQNWTMRNRAAAGVSARPADALWGGLFDDNHQTVIALADSSFALAQDITRTEASLEAYSQRRHLDELRAGVRGTELDDVISTVLSRQYTSIADAALAARIMQVHAPRTGRTTVRSARNLQIRDFRGAHAVLLGSARSNPWVAVFEPQMNFVFDYAPQTRRPMFVNRQPAAGEQRTYVGGIAGQPVGESYGLVALLPNLTRNGNVLLLAGTNMEATEAVGEFVLNTDLCSDMLKRLGIAKSRPLPPFEVLLRVKAVAGSSSDSTVIAYRVKR